jgi:probable phosphoglycerate mutase
MTRLLLTRHGHVAGIKPKHFRGRAELPLTELGHRQAKLLAARIARQWKPVAIYTSAMQRCRDTAAIADACGRRRKAADFRLIDYGAWQMYRGRNESRA